MFVLVPAARWVRGAAAVTLSHQFVDENGEPAAPTGTPTVTVTRESDGSSITPGAVAGSDTNPRTSALPAGTLSEIDWLNVVWSDGSNVAAAWTVEVVGAPLATVSEMKAIDKTLALKSSEELFAARRRVEDESLRVLRRSVVERFYTERVDGSGRREQAVSWPDVLEVVRVRVWSGSSYTDFTAAELAVIPASPAGVLERTDGAVWPCGRQNIEISYRFGMRPMPSDLREALVLSVRFALIDSNPGMPRFASRVDTVDGGTMTFASPGNDVWTTGDNAVDRVINGYRFRKVGVA